MILAVTICKFVLIQVTGCTAIQRQIKRNVMLMLTDYPQEIKPKFHHLKTKSIADLDKIQL
jgi:hypothetical protein